MNLELYFNNKDPLNTIDDRVTFLYQYACSDAWQ